MRYNSKENTLSPIVGDLDHVLLDDSWSKRETREENVYHTRSRGSKFIEQYAKPEQKDILQSQYMAWRKQQSARKI